MSWIKRLCTKNDINQKFWAHLLSVMVCGLRVGLINEGRDLSGYDRFAF